MSIAMPVWRHEAQREKEEELVFRGLQYVRAIRLYQAKTRALPPTIDALVQGRYLRKKYKDPITNDDFAPIGAAGGAPGQVGQVGQPNQPGRLVGRTVRCAGRLSRHSHVRRRTSAGPVRTGKTVARWAAFIGVVSKSTAESIRVYQGRTHYNEWPFVFVNAQPGGPGGPGGTPDGRGVPGGRGGRGRQVVQADADEIPEERWDPCRIPAAACHRRIPDLQAVLAHLP